MIMYGQAYAAQGGGSMDFWDALDEHNKRVVRMVIDTVRTFNAIEMFELDRLDYEAWPKEES